ncbi:MAG TPA: hypothetical protein VJM53_02870, partial [Burkholderiales bacterium]|nr:hypothetical protein [Burkholderiales bacterium]
KNYDKNIEPQRAQRTRRKPEKNQRNSLFSIRAAERHGFLTSNGISLTPSSVFAFLCALRVLRG